MKTFEVRDPIYGFIEFDEWEKEVINSVAFQRLRRIQQLALTSYIYPGATHTRFEHSLGTMNFASLMYDAIVSKDRNKKILEEYFNYNVAGLERTKRIVRFAALLHDLGHPPFSHAGEIALSINPNTKKNYSHEDYSVAIIINELKDIIESHQINTNYRIEIEEITSLIDGNSGSKFNILFWKNLISSQLDADRSDYLLRDSHHAGVRYGIYDYHRLLKTISIGIDPEGDDPILGINEGGFHIAEAIILARYQMNTQVYFHKTRRILDYHLEEAIKFIYNENKLPPPDQTKEYIKIDENDLWVLIKENASKNIHCQAILNRDHFREIFRTSENASAEEESAIKELENKYTSEKIEFYKDNLATAWYKIGDKNSVKNPEIMIVNENSGKVKPLTQHSKLIKEIGKMNLTRIYAEKSNKGR